LHSDESATDGLFGATFVPSLPGVYSARAVGTVGQPQLSRAADIVFLAEVANDLCIAMGDIVINPVPGFTDSIAITVRAHNFGPTAVPSAQLTISASSERVLGSSPVSIPAYDSTSVTVAIHTSWRGSDTLVVALDADYAFVEDRYDNNSVTLVVAGSPVGVLGANAGLALSLLPPSPNPAVAPVTIEFTVPAATHASVLVYDVAGRLVRTLSDGPMSPGRHLLRWDRRGEGGAAVGPGVYFCLLKAGRDRVIRRVIVLR
jgi:hypothetical protein